MGSCQGCIGDVYLEELGPAFAPLDAETEVVRQEVWAAVGALRHVTVPNIDVEVRYLDYKHFRTSSRYVVCGPTALDPEPCAGIRAYAWTWVAESQNGTGRLAQITLPITGLLPDQYRPLLVHELIHAALHSMGASLDYQHEDVALWRLAGEI
jgi:hypothetical protein